MFKNEFKKDWGNSKPEYRWMEVFVNPYILIPITLILETISVILIEDKKFIDLTDLPTSLLNDNNAFTEVFIISIVWAIMMKLFLAFVGNGNLKFLTWIRIWLTFVNIFLIIQIVGLLF